MHATATLAQCTAEWDARPRDVCILTETQAFNTPGDQAKKAHSATAMKALLIAREISEEEAAAAERKAAQLVLGR